MSFPLLSNVKVRATLENAISADKIPHALIIEGEKGQGKHTLADYIAKAFLCEGEKKPCEDCQSCRLIEKASHPDVIYVTTEDKKKFISVEQIRNLKEAVYIKPHMNTGRVIIIEAADKMNANSQNALLKVLEEPPENTCFILLTAKKEALLTTVLSRCILLSLTSPDIESGIKVVCQKAGCDGEKAETLLTASHGNIGAAIAAAGKKSDAEAYFTAKEFVKLIFDDNPYEMLKLLNPYSKNRAFMDDFISELKSAAAEELKSMNKNGKRAKVLFYLCEECDRYADFLKFNANLPLFISALVADINKQMR